MTTVTYIVNGKPVPDPVSEPEPPVRLPVLDPAHCERLRNAARRIGMAAVTVTALSEEVDPALLEAHVKGAARFLVEGVRLFREAVVEAGYEVPEEA